MSFEQNNNETLANLSLNALTLGVDYTTQELVTYSELVNYLKATTHMHDKM